MIVSEFIRKFDHTAFETVSVLSVKETGGTYLVQCKTTDQLFIKKLVSSKHIEVYTKLQQINHPNIARIIEVYRSEHHGVIIEAYIEGESLAEKLKKQQMIPEYQAVFYMHQLCLALQVLHGHDIVHRDINPNNIMITADGVLKLIDFDISKMAQTLQHQDTTILGTVGFAAPEQFGFMQTDHRSDIYSAGVLFNVMLTGLHPKEAFAENILYQNIINACISADPQDRYPSMKAMIKDVNVLLSSFSRYRLKPRIIPGFRTGKLYKKIIAVIGYLAMFFLTVSSFSRALHSENDAFTTAEDIFAPIFLLWIPFMLLTNINYFDRRMVVFKHFPRKVALFFRIVLAVIAFWGFAIVFAILDAFGIGR